MDNISSKMPSGNQNINKQSADKKSEQTPEQTDEGGISEPKEHVTTGSRNDVTSQEDKVKEFVMSIKPKTNISEADMEKLKNSKLDKDDDVNPGKTKKQNKEEKTEESRSGGTCSVSFDCGGGGGKCSVSFDCGGGGGTGGGKCSASFECGGSGGIGGSGKCSASFECGGGGGKCSTSFSCGGS
jgi:hypothetical protein